MAENVFHPNDVLASIIADAWIDDNFRTRLLDRTQAAQIFEARHILLEEPVVITEQEYPNYQPQSTNETLFVLPDKPTGIQQSVFHHKHALETARIKMAYTVQGI